MKKRNVVELSIIEGIKEGRYTKGSLLPSIRQLAAELNKSTKTVHLALLRLVDEKILEVKNRTGYIVSSQFSKDVITFAFLVRRENKKLNQPLVVDSINEALQKEATKRGWSVLLIPVDHMSSISLGQKLLGGQVSGVILNEVDQIYKDEIFRLQIPAISLDVWNEYSQFIEIVRDEYQGAYLAADYGVKRGMKNFIWYGPLKGNANAIARFGAIEGLLANHGLSMQPENIYDLNQTKTAAIDVLNSVKEPSVVFSFWNEPLCELITQLKHTKLRLGDDLEVVRWSTVEDYDKNYQRLPQDLSEKCCTVLWSVKEVAECAMNRFEEVVKNPFQKPYRICLPMRLKHPRGVH